MKNFTVTISQIYISDHEAAMIPEADRVVHQVVDRSDVIEASLAVRSNDAVLLMKEIRKLDEIVLKLINGET